MLIVFNTTNTNHIFVSYASREVRIHAARIVANDKYYSDIYSNSDDDPTDVIVEREWIVNSNHNWRSSYFTTYRGDDTMSIGIQVNVRARYDMFAMIDLCRFTANFENDCQDGEDNDCDGYIDYEDVDCV